MSSAVCGCVGATSAGQSFSEKAPQVQSVITKTSPLIRYAVCNIKWMPYFHASHRTCTTQVQTTAKVGHGFLSHIALWKVFKININNDWKIKALTHFVIAVTSWSSKKISYFSTWCSKSTRRDEIKTKQRNKSQLLILALSEIKRNLTWVIFGKNKQRRAREVKECNIRAFLSISAIWNAICWWSLQGLSL